MFEMGWPAFEMYPEAEIIVKKDKDFKVGHWINVKADDPLKRSFLITGVRHEGDKSILKVRAIKDIHV